MIDSQRLFAAYERSRTDLLAACEPTGHWVGRLASSALSTATAISALALMERASLGDSLTGDGGLRRTSALIFGGLRWLADHQNSDGGWGDTEQSLSNIATTMLCSAALHLTAVPVEHADVLDRAQRYIERQGGIPALRRRYGRDKTFAAPILANCALAERVPWSAVPALPFELACLPTEMWKRVHLPVVSYAIPALVAIGQARFHHCKPWNPITRLLRQWAVRKSLDVLERQQPASGGFLEATPLTSFVVMSLASIGQAEHPAARRGLEFLCQSVRPDGSWPIDSNLATWNTTLAINALVAGGEDVSRLDCWDWLLECQHQEMHPFTGAAPGAWAWTDLSGGVPDADDTAGALLALAAWARCDERVLARAGVAALEGVGWLLDLQNRDGGWPTFCRGWGRLPFDRSGSDLTAHALRALGAWREIFANPAFNEQRDPELAARTGRALQRGLEYLAGRQLPDGHWEPLWFGNQYQADETNPVYGTARVLLALAELGERGSPAAHRGYGWLIAAQNADGGWGDAYRGDGSQAGPQRSSVEETALAVEALAAWEPSGEASDSLQRGGQWLVRAVEEGRHHETSPIGFYFAKLWYHERLYPLTFTTSALGRLARRQLAVEQPPRDLPPARPESVVSASSPK